MNIDKNVMCLGEAKEIADSYPKSYTALRAWCRDLFPEDIRGTVSDDYTDAVAASLVEIGFRPLYEFFDSKGVIISIIPQVSISPKGEVFTYYNSKDSYSQTANTRIEAEAKAFLQAFKTLEGIL